MVTSTKMEMMFFLMIEKKYPSHVAWLMLESSVHGRESRLDLSGVLSPNLKVNTEKISK
jgi:hypothetical protein